MDTGQKDDHHANSHPQGPSSPHHLTKQGAPIFTTPTTSYHPHKVADTPSHQAVVAQSFQPEDPVYRHAPIFTTCPSCQYDIVTSIHFESGSFSVLVCCVTAIAGCFLGCCLAPFFIEGCKNVVHTCPKCLHVLATWKRM